MTAPIDRSLPATCIAGALSPTAALMGVAARAVAEVMAAADAAPGWS